MWNVGINTKLRRLGLHREIKTYIVKLINDDEVRFVLAQHAELEFYSASSLKQQSTGRHITLLGHTILIPSQSDFALSP